MQIQITQADVKKILNQYLESCGVNIKDKEVTYDFSVKRVPPGLKVFANITEKQTATSPIATPVKAVEEAPVQEETKQEEFELATEPEVKEEKTEVVEEAHIPKTTSLFN